MADTVTYIYDEKSQGPRDGVDVFKVVGGVETKIFDGEWADSSIGYGALKTEAINALKATYPDIATMTLRPRPPAPPPTPAPPPPPIPPRPTPPEVVTDKGVYYPKSKYSKPESAGQEEFVVKATKEYYKGLYVKTFDKKYFGGSSPLSGIELEKVKDHKRGLDEGMPLVLGILAGALGGFFKKKPSNSEKQSGVAKRYFVQDANNNKIVETDKSTYLQTKKEVVNRIFAEVDWIIGGPANDVLFGQYAYEGAESKNRKTIQALEATMPGISTVVTDYRYLVEDTTTTTATIQSSAQSLPTTTTTSQTFVETDPDTQLENIRKANFDTRK